MAVAELLSELGVEKTHSRPHVSNDNPYSEAHFKTMKYRPDFPERFGSLVDARSWGRKFFSWYNQEHYHSALGFLTPQMVHYGTAEAVQSQRQQVLQAAYAAHPERFVRGMPGVLELPEAVWINKPEGAEELLASAVGSSRLAEQTLVITSSKWEDAGLGGAGDHPISMKRVSRPAEVMTQA